MIEAIIFDLDDTLYAEQTYVFSAFKEVSKYIGVKFSLDYIEIYEEIKKVFYENGRGKIFDIISERYNLNEDINKLVKIYRETKPSIKLYKDSEEIIAWAKANNIKTGIITDGASEVQWNKLKALNLINKVDEIVVSDDLGREHWKPSKKPYEVILKKLKVDPEETMYVGDNPNKDFLGAKKLRMKTIRIIRKSGDHMKTNLSRNYEADLTIYNDLNALKLLIEKEYCYV